MKRLICMVIIFCITVLSSACRLPQPKQSNKELTIWYVENVDVLYKQIIPKFESLYPDVKLNVENIELSYTRDSFNEDFGNKLATAIMVGEGPDVIQLFDVAGASSITKMMNSSTFADLSEFYNSDESIDKNDIYQSVMDAGCFEGKRYVIPLTFKVPVLVTNRKQIELSKIDISKCNTYDGLIS